MVLSDVDLSQQDVNQLKQKGFQLNKLVTNGTYSSICCASFQSKKVIAKVVYIAKSLYDYSSSYLIYDHYVSQNLKHKYLIEIIDVLMLGSDDNEKMVIFMEFGEGGDLLSLLEATNAPLPEDQARCFYRQFIEAVRYMHSKGFSHGNIKCEKIVLNQDRTICKLTDFGISRHYFRFNSKSRLLDNTFCPSAAYEAPEMLMLNKEICDPQAKDVWSLGVVLFVLINYRLPFSCWNLKLWIQSQLQRNYLFNGDLSLEVKDLINKHLNPNPTTRANIEEIFVHEWLQKQKVE